MLDVLFEVILPVLAVAVVGAFVGRRFGIQAPVLSTLSFNLFSPALVFSSLADLDLGGSETVRVAGVVIAGMAVTMLIGGLAARAGGAKRPTVAAVALTAGVYNAGNLGLPVSALAFGEAGFEIAIVAFVAGAVATNSLGVVAASMAGSSMAGGLRQVLLVPSLWAAAAGLVVNARAVDLPAVVAESSATLAAAAVPVMLVVLGLQLRLDIRLADLADVSIAVVVRLVAGPAVAYGLATLVGLSGLTRDVLTVLGGMPAAVFTTILATQYKASPELVTRIVVVGTLVSTATLTVLIDQYR